MKDTHAHTACDTTYSYFSVQKFALYIMFSCYSGWASASRSPAVGSFTLWCSTCASRERAHRRHPAGAGYFQVRLSKCKFYFKTGKVEALNTSHTGHGKSLDLLIIYCRPHVSIIMFSGKVFLCTSRCCSRVSECLT